MAGLPLSSSHTPDASLRQHPAHLQVSDSSAVACKATMSSTEKGLMGAKTAAICRRGETEEEAANLAARSALAFPREMLSLEEECACHLIMETEEGS